MRTLLLALLLVLLLPAAHAATVTVSQSGADPGTVMKGRYFTITVSGLSGTGTVSLINLPSGINVEEGTTKSFGSGTSSVSWTTAIASQTLTGQKIQVSISTTGSPQSVESSAFDIVLPPSLELSVSPTSFTDPSGDKNLQLTIKNWGETTARDVVVAISLPSGVSLKSGSASQEISTILGGTGGSGESKGISWTLSFGSVSNSSINITVTSSNADTKSVSIPVTVTTAPSQAGGTTGGGGGGGGASTRPNSKEIPKILTGESYQVTFDAKYVPDIASIEIFAAVDQFYTKITVDTYAEKPRWVVFDDAPGKVYRYFRIKYSKPNTYITKAKITFKVNETWLKAEDIDPSTVVLYRLNAAKQWEALSTTPLKSENGMIYYVAETPGFSWFAVSAKEGSGFKDIFAQVDGKAEPAPPEPEEKPEEKPVVTTPPPPETAPPPKTPPEEVKPKPTPKVEEKKPEKRGICGPTAVALLATLPLLLGRRLGN